MRFLKFTRITLAGLIAIFTSESAIAHVKWFSPYTLDNPPLPLHEVITTEFFYLYIASILSIYAFFWLDRYLFRIKYLAGMASKLALTEEQSLLITRLATFAFFVSLFIYGLQGSAFILTPELKTMATIIPWMQLVIGL